jgi:hypothetical protein
MTRGDRINIALFVTTACMIVLASQGGLGGQDVWSRGAFSIGIGMLGGIICGTTLYGINALKVAPMVRGGAFGGISRNQDLREDFWLGFIADLADKPDTAWFVGSRQHVWIDTGFAYRAALKQKLIERINRAMKDRSNAGWNIYVIVTYPDAAKKWCEFIEEVRAVTNYQIKRPDLIRIGVVDPSMVHYSIVTYSKGMVIIPYTSRGRAAESPTFEVRPECDVADLYRNDLSVIKDAVPLSGWEM